MNSLVWERAQEEELKWWSDLKERLRDPANIERKRQSSLAIWRNILNLGAPPDAKVLEIGTGGDGFVNFVPVSHPVGLEPLLRKMKSEGVGIFASSVHFVCGMGESLPFSGDTFDVVFLYNVLDHMANPSAALDEIARVLRKGGILHLLVDTYSFRFKLYRRFLRPDPMHPHVFTSAEVRRRLKRRSLKVVLDVSDQVPAGKRRGRAVRVFCVMTT